MATKCPGAETLLRAVIDNGEGVRGAIKRNQWLAGQSPEYLQELADSCGVLAQMAVKALEARAVRRGH